MVATETQFPDVGARTGCRPSYRKRVWRSPAALSYFTLDPTPESPCTTKPVDSVKEDNALRENSTTNGNLGL